MKTTVYAAQVWGHITDLPDPPEPKRHDYAWYAFRPGYSVDIIRFAGPLDGRLFPPDVEASVIRSAIVEGYATDDGVVAARYVDRIPFVPFYKE